MKYLLDVNVLIGAIITSHPLHASAISWLSGKEVVLCPISELGFVRISTHKKAFGLPMDAVRKALEKFTEDAKAEWIAADLKFLESHPANSDQVTDHYLADLASKHGLKLATFDAALVHSATELLK